MMLKDIIKFLEGKDPNIQVPMGFTGPMSYRGYYDQLAFAKESHTFVGDMLSQANSALGQSFEGYKGGFFIMSSDTPCWIAEWGEEGEEISLILLKYMVGDYKEEESKEDLEIIIKNCSTCKFFSYEDSESRSVCRRYPRTLLHAPIEDSFSEFPSKFPRAWEYDWCGEWGLEERDEEKKRA